MINNYYSHKQLKKWIITFANVFAGLQVHSGKDGCGEISVIDVPITYASKDRVVTMLGSSGTQNKQHSLPMMCCYLTNLELAPERRHGVNMLDRRTYVEQGGVVPADIKSARRIMPIPYNALFELNIYASNTDQMFQMLEQIFIIFDPDIQVQKSDAPFDWIKTTKIELTGISNEENVPLGSERRVITWNLSFEMPIWLTPPMEIRDDIINKIHLRMGDIENFSLNEFDENGEPQPFASGNLFSEDVVDQNSVYIPTVTNPTTLNNSDEPHGYHNPTTSEPNNAFQYEAFIKARELEKKRLMSNIENGSNPI